MVKDSSRSRGRPRSFDKDAALDAAIGVFWRMGYANASLDDLTAAMNISRPSLYAAFKDKEGLYLACVRKHGDRMSGGAAWIGENASDGPNGLEKLLLRAIQSFTHPDPFPRGCFFAAACMSDVVLEPEFQQVIDEQLGRVRDAIFVFLQRFPPETMSVDTASNLASTILYGLGGRARLGHAAETLHCDAKAFVRMLYPSSDV